VCDLHEEIEPALRAAREVWVVAGRRGGKSRIASLIAVYLACFRAYSDVLASAEVGTLPVVAADRRQARTAMSYHGKLLARPGGWVTSGVNSVPRNSRVRSRADALDVSPAHGVAATNPGRFA
jgi:hypothetical protein